MIAECRSHAGVLYKRCVYTRYILLCPCTFSSSKLQSCGSLVITTTTYSMSECLGDETVLWEAPLCLILCFLLSTYLSIGYFIACAVLHHKTLQSTLYLHAKLKNIICFIKLCTKVWTTTMTLKATREHNRVGGTTQFERYKFYYL